MVQRGKKTDQGVGKTMKTAIVYYSMLGNTEYSAKKIAEELAKNGEADLIRIEPEKAYPDKGARKFLWGGKSAVMGDKPALKPYTFDIGQYERIIFGFPVWASNITPPIRTFLEENSGLKEKKLAAFVCFSGGGAQKAIDRLKSAIGVEKLDAELILVDPKDKPKSENDEKISAFCAQLT